MGCQAPEVLKTLVRTDYTVRAGQWHPPNAPTNCYYYIPTGL